MKPQARGNRGVLASPHASAEAIVRAAMMPPKGKKSRRKKPPPPPNQPEPPQQEQSASSPEKTNPSDAPGTPSAPDALNGPLRGPAKGQAPRDSTPCL